MPVALKRKYYRIDLSIEEGGKKEKNGERREEWQSTACNTWRQKKAEKV